MTAVLHPRVAARRGAARARTWWGKAWVRAVEESAYSESDLGRGRALARSGRIGGITVDAGSFLAAVADGDEVWTVSGGLPRLDPQQATALLAGDLPFGLVEHAEEAGVELLPYGGELAATCTCAAWTDPCPHGLAVLYQLAWLVDDDPLVLFALRGLGRDELLSRLHELTAVTADDDGDLDIAGDAAARATRVLELLDDPAAPVDHLI